MTSTCGNSTPSEGVENIWENATPSEGVNGHDIRKTASLSMTSTCGNSTPSEGVENIRGMKTPSKGVMRDTYRGCGLTTENSMLPSSTI